MIHWKADFSTLIASGYAALTSFSENESVSSVYCTTAFQCITFALFYLANEIMQINCFLKRICCVFKTLRNVLLRFLRYAALTSSNQKKCVEAPRVYLHTGSILANNYD